MKILPRFLALLLVVIVPVFAADASVVGGNADLSAWSKLRLTMTQAEVTALVGKPNLSTARRWVYSGSGTITFDEAGKVSGLTLPAPAAPARAEPPPMMTMEEIHSDGKVTTTVKSSATIRSGVQASAAEINLALALVQDGWVYVMPQPKSAQARWGNTDGRTTWFRGYWKNTRTNQTSLMQPVAEGRGFRGDGAVTTGAWSNGGAPVVSKVQWLASKEGGPSPSSVR